MKKYIYSALLVAVVTAVAIFFFRPPEVTRSAPPTVLEVTFRLPDGYEFTEGAPFVLTWRSESPSGVLSVPVPDKQFNPLVSPYKLLCAPAPGSKAVILNARLYYCDKTTRMCFQGDFQTRVPVEPGSVLAVPCVWDVTPKKA